MSIRATYHREICYKNNSKELGNQKEGGKIKTMDFRKVDSSKLRERLVKNLWQASSWGKKVKETWQFLKEMVLRHKYKLAQCRGRMEMQKETNLAKS